MKFLPSTRWALLALIVVIPTIILISFIAVFTIIVIILEEISLFFIVPLKFREFYIPFKKDALLNYVSAIRETLQLNKS